MFPILISAEEKATAGVSPSLAAAGDTSKRNVAFTSACVLTARDMTLKVVSIVVAVAAVAPPGMLASKYSISSGAASLSRFFSSM